MRAIGSKDKPERYSLFLDTNELVGETYENNSVLLDSTKNILLYPLKDMVLYIRFHSVISTNVSIQDRLELQKTISVFGVDLNELEMCDDDGIYIFIISTSVWLFAFLLITVAIVRFISSAVTCECKK